MKKKRGGFIAAHCLEVQDGGYMVVPFLLEGHAGYCAAGDHVSVFSPCYKVSGSQSQDLNCNDFA